MFLCAGVGTFAVVSLMVGSAVDAANCDTVSSSSSGHLNTTNMSSVTESAESSSSHGVSPEMQCRVGVAVAMTFLAGIYQVTSPPLFNRHFQSVVYVFD